MTFSEDRAKRFEAYGWQTIDVDDGNDLDAIDAALDAARADTTRPTLILVRTHLGFGSPEQDSFKAHGSPLGVADVAEDEAEARLADRAGLLRARRRRSRGFARRSSAARTPRRDWNERFAAYAHAFPELAARARPRLSGELPAGWDADIPVFAADAKAWRRAWPAAR